VRSVMMSQLALARLANGDEFESQQEIGESSTMPDDGDGADSSIGE